VQNSVIHTQQLMSCMIPLKRICQLKYNGFSEQAVSLLYKHEIKFSWRCIWFTGTVITSQNKKKQFLVSAEQLTFYTWQWIIYFSQKIMLSKWKLPWVTQFSMNKQIQWSSHVTCYIIKIWHGIKILCLFFVAMIVSFFLSLFLYFALSQMEWEKQLYSHNYPWTTKERTIKF